MKKTKPLLVLLAMILCLLAISCDNSINNSGSSTTDPDVPTNPDELVAFGAADLLRIQNMISSIKPSSDPILGYTYESKSDINYEYKFDNYEFDQLNLNGTVTIHEQDSTKTVNGELAPYAVTNLKVVLDEETYEYIKESGTISKDGAEITAEEENEFINDVLSRVLRLGTTENITMTDMTGTKNITAKYVDSPFIATSPDDDAIYTVNGELYASEKIENAILHKDSTCTITVTAPGTTKKLTGQSSYSMDINSENGPYDISFEYLSYNGTYYDTSTIAEEYKLDILRFITAE